MPESDGRNRRGQQPHVPDQGGRTRGDEDHRDLPPGAAVGHDPTTQHHDEVPLGAASAGDARAADRGLAATGMTTGPVDPVTGQRYDRRAVDRLMPRWVIPAVAVFWTGFLLTGALEATFDRLSTLLLVLAVSLFLALAIEPGVDRLTRRGWRRGRATLTVLGAVLVSVFIFVGAIGTLIGTQIADLLQNSDRYITDTVDVVNDTFGTEIDAQDVIDDFNDPDGRVQEFIASQRDEALRLSVAVVGVVFQVFTALLFTFYLVADGPRLRRVICSRLRPARQERVLHTWELAITKTGGYLYSRALLALISAFFHWVVFQAIGIQAPIPLALWVGLVSQFLPVVGTYLAGILPVLIMFLDSPLKAAVVAITIIVYQQIENYFFAPRITARTMELHPAFAFGAALAGASLLGFVGAILALPAAAMLQALLGEIGQRYDVVDSELVAVEKPPPRPRNPLRRSARGG